MCRDSIFLYLGQPQLKISFARQTMELVRYILSCYDLPFFFLFLDLYILKNESFKWKPVVVLPFLSFFLLSYSPVYYIAAEPKPNSMFFFLFLNLLGLLYLIYLLIKTICSRLVCHIKLEYCFESNIGA